MGKEIESILYLYPYAMKRHTDIVLMLNQKIRQKEIDSLKEKDLFYLKVIDIVNSWLSNLYEDEKEALTYRYFKRFNYKKITMIELYENHSSAIKKNNAIIRKIEKEGSDLL